MSETVTIGKKEAAALIAGTLNIHVWDDGTPDDQGCCPECCGPCHAVRALLDADQLDDILRGTYFSVGWSFWNDDLDQVDRAVLEHGWRMEDCHSSIHFEVDGTEYAADVKRGEDRTFWVEVEGVPGCFATGRTIDELTEAAMESVRMCTGSDIAGHS